jgi:hypothetical protein
MPHKRIPSEKDVRRPDHEPWQHSTGPKTDEGKAISSQNARTHGCTSTQLILPNEDPAEWEALKTAWLRDYSPDCDTFRELVLAAATAQWFLRRNDKRLNEAEQFLHTEAHASPLFWLEPQHRLYERILRYRTAAERSFLRARAAVEQYRRSRFLEQKELIRRAERSERLTLEHAPDNDDRDDSSGSVPSPKPVVRTVLQHFRIYSQDRVLVTSRPISNAEILQTAGRLDPPVQIRRLFRFEDFPAGVVPPEYEWIRQTPENRGRKDDGYFLEFSRSEFRHLAALEEAHAGPHLPDSSPITVRRNGRKLEELLD